MGNDKLCIIPVLDTDAPEFAKVARKVSWPQKDPGRPSQFWPAMSGFNVGSGSDVDISYLESSRSEPSNGFDRHLNTEELFVCLEGEYVMPMAPCRRPDDPDDEPRIEDLIAFRVRAGDAYLGMEIIDAIARKDVPKCVRRNVLGADFLAIFCDLALEMSLQGPERIREFYDSASELVQNYPWSDRGVHNIGSLLITLLSSREYEGSLVLRNIHADEALIRGTTSTATIHGSGISQLDIRGANVESLEFINSHITTLTVDEITHVSPSIPLPSQIQYNRLHSDRSRVISSREDIDGWLRAHGRVVAAGDTVGEGAGTIPKELLNHPMRRLLRRACRNRSFWTLEGSTNYVKEFTRDPCWPDLLSLMQGHNLIKEETIAAAGTNSRFFHIKQPIRILAEDMDDENVKSFYEALIDRMRNTP